MSAEAKMTEAVAVYHLADEGGNKEGYPGTADLTTKGFLAPLSTEDIALSEGQYDKAHKLFAPVIDIRESDKLVINGTTYKVGGKQTYGFGSPNAHLELIIYEPNS